MQGWTAGYATVNFSIDFTAAALTGGQLKKNEKIIYLSSMEWLKKWHICRLSACTENVKYVFILKYVIFC